MKPSTAYEPQAAVIIHEYGPFADIEVVHGVTFDGRNVWLAVGDRLVSVDPETGTRGRALTLPADAGSAFDGSHFYQLAGGQIQKIDPATGAVLATVPSPAGTGSAGLTWAEGALWVAHYRDRTIFQIDPRSGEVLRTLTSTKFVTGVTFADGALWHGTWENEESEIRRISKETGEVLESVRMPAGAMVSGLEFDGDDAFYCGAGPAGTVRKIRRG